MAALNDTIVTETVNAGMDAILAAAGMVDDPHGRLKVLTGCAALLLQLARRSFSPLAVTLAFNASKAEMRRAAEQDAKR